MQCETCGYPRQECGPIPIFPNGEEPGTCASCGREVALDGRSIAFEHAGVIVPKRQREPVGRRAGQGVRPKSRYPGAFSSTLVAANSAPAAPPKTPNSQKP